MAVILTNKLNRLLFSSSGASNVCYHRLRLAFFLSVVNSIFFLRFGSFREG
jgi:hypothetical protein